MRHRNRPHAILHLGYATERHHRPARRGNKQIIQGIDIRLIFAIYLHAYFILIRSAVDRADLPAAERVEQRLLDLLRTDAQRSRAITQHPHLYLGVPQLQVARHVSYQRQRPQTRLHLLARLVQTLQIGSGHHEQIIAGG